MKVYFRTFSVIPIKIPAGSFFRNREASSKMHIVKSKARIAKMSLKKKKTV